MRSVALALTGAFALAACGEPAREPADAPVAATAQPAAVAGPVALGEADLATVCQAGVGAVYGQSGDDVAVLNRAGGVITVGWRAPVDGGQLTAECRIDGNRVLWRPLHRPVASENRWMDQPGDPVITFALNEGQVEIAQEMPVEAGTGGTQ